MENLAIKRIFVVDDERCIADTLSAILRNCGYDASACYDPHTALEHCEFLAPDLVISDVVMPGMDGIDMSIRIKQRHPGCKIFLFSGVAATSDLLRDPRLQGYDFEVLAKPIHPEDLLAKVAHARQPATAAGPLPINALGGRKGASSPAPRVRQEKMPRSLRG